MCANNRSAATTALAGVLFDRYIRKPLWDWRARRMAMDDLVSLDEHALADIGITRGEVVGNVIGKIVPRRAINDRLGDYGWVKAWRWGDEHELRARFPIRRRLSMLGLALAGDAMILGAVLFLTGAIKF